MMSSSLRPLLPLLAKKRLWSPWIPLVEAPKSLPHSAGLYRIRLDHELCWLYLGQTTNLADRMRGLARGVFDSVMPYSAPHVAGPALYAYRHIYPEATLLVSVCQLGVSDQMRLGLESLSIALHRQYFQHSPRCQFGRMPAEKEKGSFWRASSGNSAQLVARGKRFRGGPTDVPDESHLPDIAPLGALDQGEPFSPTWFNLPWTPWMEPAAAIAECGGMKSKTEGIYRICSADNSHLLFIGQGKIAQRLAQYKKKLVLCSWAEGTWYPHQRLAIVTDLIGSYLFLTGEVPQAQFIAGRQSDEEPKLELVVFQLPLLLALA